jgi:DNA-binding PadR family transcriptional regulator
MPDDPAPAPLSEPSYFILLSLAAGPRHGYAVLKDAEQLSQGRISLSVSTLYTALARLQAQGMIERVDAGEEEPAPGLPRKVYRLTQPGQAVLDAEAWRLRQLLAAYQQRIGAESR